MAPGQFESTMASVKEQASRSWAQYRDATLGKTKRSHDEDNPLRGEARFAAYLARVKTVFVRTLKSNVRMLAYSSDVGEAARPLVPPFVVNGAYVVAIGYVVTDVAYTGWLEQQRGSSPELVARQTLECAVFQGLASLLIPTVVIHTAVHQSQKMLQSAPKPLARWGPSVVGLGLIPFMPLADPPVEHMVEWGFDRAWPLPPGVKRTLESADKAEASEPKKVK